VGKLTPPASLVALERRAEPEMGLGVGVVVHIDVAVGVGVEVGWMGWNWQCSLGSNYSNDAC